MLLVNLTEIPGREFDLLGVVKGNSIIKKSSLGNQLPVYFGNIFKRDKTEYYEMIANSVITGRKDPLPESNTQADEETMKKARQAATDNMIKEAEALGADAIISVKYETTGAIEGKIEVLTYGTAVRLK